MPFPSVLSKERGEAMVQISRNIHPGLYENSTPAPEGGTYQIAQGESSILEHYKVAIHSAKRTIYFENQHFFHHQLMEEYLLPALERGVFVLVVMPVIPMGAIERARKGVEAFKELMKDGQKTEEAKPPPYLQDFHSFVKLEAYDNFMLCGLAVNVTKKQVDEEGVWCSRTKEGLPQPRFFY